MQLTRVLVIEDSLTVRRHIVEVLSETPGFEVVGEAEDGKRGIELCEKLRPDVVSLDMMLPIMSGLAATEYIMAYCPTPILIVSSSINRGEAFKTYDALAAGAVDVLDKPTGDEVLDADWESRFTSTLRIVSRIKVITHPRARLALAAQRASQPIVQARSGGSAPRVIAIGISTGGPAALVTLLNGLPPDFPIPILIVIHIGKLFAPQLAEWLDGVSPLRVSYAKDGELLPLPGKGRVILAPPDVHLVLSGDRLVFDRGPERHSCRPSVDNLFFSLARLGPECVACLLTGMGRDGAEGLLAIRQAGGLTIAQDEASSVVFGMPREAIARGAAEQVLPIDRIAAALLKLTSNDKSPKEAP